MSTLWVPVGNDMCLRANFTDSHVELCPYVSSWDSHVELCG